MHKTSCCSLFARAHAHPHACTQDELLFKLSNAEGDITEDVALIESLEESKRVATEINEKVGLGLRELPPALQMLGPWSCERVCAPVRHSTEVV